MMKRDLKADLGWIQKVTKTAENAPSQALNRRIEHVFVEKAREGWPRAIERAIKAEALVRELVGVIDELRRQINECGLDGEMWDVYQKAKEVLGDE